MDLSAATGALRTGGVPLFVDTAADLVRKPHADADSWYVNCLFRCGGQLVGFEWHQMFSMQTSTTEFLLMNASERTWRPHALAEPISARANASESACRVWSGLGVLSGERSRLSLQLEAGDDALSVVLTPQSQELYNGTTGLLPLMGGASFQYAFPNVRAEGTLTIAGKQFAIDAARAWLDRQWSKAEGVRPDPPAAAAPQMAWSWFGLAFGEGHRQAVSFWHFRTPSGPSPTFVTVLREDGLQVNAPAQVQYEGIWTSPRSGLKYPSSAKVSSEQFGLHLHLQALIDEPEFVYAAGQGLSGCQAPCRATGRIGAVEIDQPVIFELIGNIGG